MSEHLRELASWRKSKTPVIRKYLAEHAKLLSEIAGRGFKNLPGYAYDLENEIELAAKLGLSELNYKILEETIERELKQMGIDYNNAYITARIIWESEKQSLIAAWDAELSIIKQGMAGEEETLNSLAIEVDARQAVLINAKTAIDIEMEGYRTQLATLDAATASYEIQLANAKLLTAQKKLEIIPVIERIITKEQELIILEQGKGTYYSQLIAAEQETATKKQQMIPGLAELATVTNHHAALIPSQIAIEHDIAEEKLEQSNVKNDLSEKEVEKLKEDIKTENKGIGISAAKRDLNDKQFGNEQTLISTEIINENRYQNDVNNSFNSIINDERATQAKIISDKTEINAVNNSSRLESAGTITQANINAAGSETAAGIHAGRNVAEAQAAAHITAQLTHLIG
ncbi:MAG: hypothetical protein PHW12_08215 [Smithella sp.]|nr:hypothetical protein [Smithella sp.]